MRIFGPPRSPPNAMWKKRRAKRQEGSSSYADRTVSSTKPSRPRLREAYRRFRVPYTFLEGEIEAPGRNKKSHSSPSGEMAHSRGRIPPLVQASAPRAVRGLENLSHLRKTLNPGVPGLPFEQASFDASGQWPMCRADASPTEDPHRRAAELRQPNSQFQCRPGGERLSTKKRRRGGKNAKGGGRTDSSVRITVSPSHTSREKKCGDVSCAVA